MKKWITAAFITLLFSITAFPTTFALESAVFDGTGTEEDPYQISTAQELRLLARRVNAGDEKYNAAHYLLTADVDLREEHYTPIGLDLNRAFRGVFDGGEHMISELRILEKAEGCSHYGLFGVLNGGEIRNVTVAGYISGSPVSGGIVGLNHGGKVVNCMANCTVSASHSDHVGRQVIGTAGGIVGINEAGGLVANSCYTNFYHDACVYGEGIVHTNREDSRVVNCFSSGKTVMVHHEGEFENSYLRYDPESLPDEREDHVWYFSAYFTDENGKLTPVNRLVGEEVREVKKESIWGGETTLLGALNAWVAAQEEDGYRFWTQEPGQYPILGEYPSQSPFSGGTGTEEDPYQISTAQEFRLLAERINAGDTEYNAAYYRLTNDINLHQESFVPIGIDLEHSFHGVFDGGFQTISGLTVYGTENSKNHGLFGVLNGGEVRNLTVVGNITGSPIAGGIAGSNHGGKIINCIANCSVNATFFEGHRAQYGAAGGIVGINEAGGIVANSCYTNSIQESNVYGLGIAHTNRNDEGSIVVNCYSSGQTNGNGFSGSWENCYARAGDFAPCDAFFEDEGGLLLPASRDSINKSSAQISVFGGETTLLGALNAWVDAQGNDEYQHWVQRPGHYPSFGENLITCDYQVGDYVRPGSSGPFVEVGTPDDYGLSTCAAPESFPMMKGVSRTVWFWQYEDYPIYDVLVDGQSVGSILSYTFPGDGKDHTVTVRYTKVGTTENFTQDIPYHGYPDVDENAWYGSEREGVVKEATQLGLFKGDERGHFNPDATLTLAEAVKLAAVIRDTYRGEEYSFDQTQGGNWYDTYVTYALEQGILKAEDFEDYQRPATRGELAYIFYGNGKVLPEYKMVSDRKAPDVEEDHPYYIETVLLYQAGVLRGSDELGTFHPDAPITRAEVAAIAVRVALPEQRISTS